MSERELAPCDAKCPAIKSGDTSKCPRGDTGGRDCWKHRTESFNRTYEENARSRGQYDDHEGD